MWKSQQTSATAASTEVQKATSRSWQACSCNYPIPVYSTCVRAKDVHQGFSSWLESLPYSTIGTQARFSLVCASRDRMTASEKVKVNIWDPTNWMQLQVYCNLKTQGGERGGQGLFKDPAYPMVEMICVAYQKHILITNKYRTVKNSVYMAQNFSLGFWQCSEFDFIMTSCVYLRRSLHHPIAHCEKQQGTERKKTENIFLPNFQRK